MALASAPVLTSSGGNGLLNVRLAHRTFKPRLTKNVKRKIEKLASERDWVERRSWLRGQGERGTAHGLETAPTCGRY